MSADFEIPTEEITVGKTGKFTVRGLNAEDIVFLSQVYWDDAIKLITEYGKKHKGVVPKHKVFDFVMDLAKMFPTMSAEIISRCAEAPEQMNKFRQLSFVKQVEALTAIVKLSTEDGHELKKWGAGLASLLEANGLPLGPLSNKLQNITRDSGKQSATSS